MQKFTLTINGQVTTKSGIDIATGAIVEITVNGVQSLPSYDEISYECRIYSSLTNYNAGKEPISLEGMHVANERFKFSAPLQSFRKNITDFTFATEMSAGRTVLTSASVDSLKGKIKEDLAAALTGITTTDIS